MVPIKFQCGNYRNSLSHFFGKNFVKVTVLLQKLLNSWFDEIFCQSTVNFLCCMICLHALINISCNHFTNFTKYFLNDRDDFTEICVRNFRTTIYGKSSRVIISRKSLQFMSWIFSAKWNRSFSFTLPEWDAGIFSIKTRILVTP